MRDNLKHLLELLLVNEIDFVLAGGLACVVHGSTMVTQDLDICLSIDPLQIEKLRKALKDVNARHRMNPNYKPSFQDYPETLESVNNIYLETDLGVLDILSELKPIGSFTEVSSRAISVPLYGYHCKIVSIEDLIQIKKSMKRPKDKEMVIQLEEILRRTKQTS